MSDRRPIGLFDSGVGGLTVLQSVRRRLPRESTIYLGDNERAPYGPRTDAEVIRYSGECLDQLVERDVKAIVVACNTSASVALPWLRRRTEVPILGVVRPGAFAAAAATRSGRIGVIATQATVRSGAYPAAIVDERPDAQVTAHPTTALVPLVEAGQHQGPEVEAAVAEALAPLLAADGPAIDTLLLGCTHYPLLGEVIGRAVGPGIAVIDSASATASALAVVLEVDGIAAPPDQVPVHELGTTGDVAAFERTARRLFGDAVTDVRQVRLPRETVGAGVGRA
ncbi:MAG: glutamate racemase [Chloroflexi bacterium]|nr:glutamate racemase [Chloroflexota bacterium]